MKQLFCIAFLFLPGFSLFAQLDSIQLPQVVVTQTKTSLYAIGNQQETFDQKLIFDSQVNNLSDLASKYSGIFINAQGPGLLNSPSARGSDAGHTAVLWNGFNIQNSMNGVVDFSLIPTGNFESINIDYGGAGALYGSGAIGSTISLNSQKKIESGWHGKISSGFGSFGHSSQEGQIRFGTKKMLSSIALTHSKAENDFEYIYDQQKGKQRNSTFRQKGIHQDNSIYIADNQFLKTFIWYQDTDRQIAPSATEGDSDARQEDHAFRAGFEYSLFKKKNTLKARSAYFDEYLFFESQFGGSESYTKALITELENAYQLSSKHILNIGLHHTFDYAKSNAFDGVKKRNRLALFTSLKSKYWNQKGVLIASLRQEITDEKWVPLMPSLGSELRISNAFQLQTKIAGMYKLPNFNDLFWPELGNPELLPESGWTAELGGIFKKQRFHVQGTAFNSFTDNLILWAPVNGIWQPANQRSVWARGVSSDAQINWDYRSFGARIDVGYEFTRSTIRKKGNETDPNIVGKQLVFRPKHQFKSSVRFEYKNTRIAYNYIVAGKRYSTADNTQSVAAYQIADVSAGQSFKMKDLLFNLQFQIKNLWNRNFVILPARPMPMRHYSLKLSLDF